MSYIVESGIPLNDNQSSHAGAKYPFREMDTGESFFVPKNMAKKAISAAHVFAFRTELKFKCRTQKCGGVRIWRVE